MIDKDLVKKLVNEKLDSKMFLVEVNVTERNRINIFIDSFDGLTIDQCVNISRYVEHNLDREEEDFELQVSSPGLGEKFRVKEQYIKYTGRQVQIESQNGDELKGVILKADDEGIMLETSEKIRVGESKKKQLVVKQYHFKYNEIKSTKAVISFK